MILVIDDSWKGLILWDNTIFVLEKDIKVWLHCAIYNTSDINIINNYGCAVSGSNVDNSFCGNSIGQGKNIFLILLNFILVI